jgi:DNA-3-methyladenine glycosylase
MTRIIKAKALRSQKTVAIARWLLGKYLVRATPRGPVARMITEVEAYHSGRDRACHASRGRTPRTETLFAPGGVWYVYLCYGMHEMLNLVTGPADFPAAVLIRGVDGIRGPGRVTKALGVDRRLNRAPCAPASGLWIEDRGRRIPRNGIVATPRVGVDYAGRFWGKKPWRFVLTDTGACSPTIRRDER